MDLLPTINGSGGGDVPVATLFAAGDDHPGSAPALSPPLLGGGDSTTAATRRDESGSGGGGEEGPCSPELYDFVIGYLSAHGYAALCVCVAGVLLNAVVVVVLTKKQMRNPVNTLLTLLACVQLALLALYVPFDVIAYAAADDRLPLFVTPSYAAAAYMLFYINAAVLLHTIGTWLIITTALFRYVCVQFPVQSAAWCSQRRARLAAGLVVVASVAACAPNMFRNAIVVWTPDDWSGGGGGPPTPAADVNGSSGSPAAADHYGGRGDNESRSWQPVAYTVNSSAPFLRDEHLQRMNYWLYGLLAKIVPSLLLLVLTGLLIGLLRTARRRRMRLYCQAPASSVVQAPPSPSPTRVAEGARHLTLPTIVLPGADGDDDDSGGDGEDAKGGSAKKLRARAPPRSPSLLEAGGGDRRWTAADAAAAGGGAARRRGSRERQNAGSREHLRTTRMLLAVVVLFLAVELPHGCLVIASAIDKCHHQAYNMLGDLIDLATLIAFSVNFALYCSMSKRFRELFTGLLCSSRARLRRLSCVKDALSGGGRGENAKRRKVGADSGERSTPKSIPLFRSSARRKGGGSVRRGGEPGANAQPTKAADAWSAKSSLDSFQLEVEPQHTSVSQLLCSSSSGSEESLAAATSAGKS